jgi:hypothetical protein
LPPVESPSDAPMRRCRRGTPCKARPIRRSAARAPEHLLEWIETRLAGLDGLRRTFAYSTCIMTAGSIIGSGAATQPAEANNLGQHATNVQVHLNLAAF